MTGALWERESELAALRAAVQATAQGSGRLVVLEGPPGVGKSSLLASARAEAGRLELPVLAARGRELERGVPFGLARQLFLPSLLGADESERARLLSGPASLAVPLFGTTPVADLPLGEGQAGALVEGLYWLAVNLARPAASGSGPAGLVLVVDDAQWADRSTLRFLGHAVGQLEEVALCVLVAVRTGEPDAPADLLGRLRVHPGCVRLRPSPLSQGAVQELVRAEGFPDAAEEFCGACGRVSGGNPFLLHELLAALRDDHVRPSAAAARDVEALLPAAVLDAVVVRLGRLPEAAVGLARAVAVLGEAPLPLAAALADLDVGAAEEAADALTAAQLLGPGEPLTFVHPLMAGAVLADLPPLARARAHRRAAELLHRDGAGAGRVAGHLLETRPRGDRWTGEVLRAAARATLANAEADSAVRLLRRALAEPPPPDERDATLVELAQAEAAADSPDAVQRLVQALDHVRDPHRRAEAYHELARLVFFKGDLGQAADAAERGLAEVEPGDELASRLLSATLTAATFEPTLRGRVTDGLAPFLTDARAGRPPADPLVCAHLSARMAIAGEPASVVRPVAEGAFARSPLVDEAAHGVVLAFPVVALMYVDELDAAARALAAALATERARRSLITLTVAQHWSAVVAHRRGDLLGASAHADRARTACRTQDWTLYVPWMAANSALIAIDRGDLETARAALGSDRDDEDADPIGHSLKLEARGRLAEAVGNSAEAEARFLAAGAILEGLGLVSPGFMSWRSAAALAAARLGHGKEAGELAAAELELARRVGGRRTLGIAVRACALLGPPDRAVALLSESAALLEGSGARLEHARSLAALGAAHRRAGERTAARGPLREALDTATRAGAEPLARQVRDELLAAGGRPRRPHVSGVGALTPMERRVAELAARSRTNSQIAHELYVTTKTVEWHLANVFRKLGVATRQELPALDGGSDQPALVPLD